MEILDLELNDVQHKKLNKFGRKTLDKINAIKLSIWYLSSVWH